MKQKIFEVKGEIKTNKGTFVFDKVTVSWRRDEQRISAIWFEDDKGCQILVQVDPENAVYPADTIEQILQIPWYIAELIKGTNIQRVKREA